MSARTGPRTSSPPSTSAPSDYIAKPLRLAEVCARVRAQLQFRRTSLSQQQQAERLRLIVDSMDEGLMVIEPMGASSTPTRPATATSAMAPDELAGSALDDLLAPLGGPGIPRPFSHQRARPGARTRAARAKC
jgi:two-component system cell cycle response regulator